MDLLKTSLHEEHVKLNAKMAPFAGFEMPLQYASAKDEVHAVRNKSGVFDVSHMGEFFVEGKEAAKFVDYFMTNDFLSLEDNQAVYSPICRENGTIIDDHISYKINNELVLICVNASNIKKDWEWLNNIVKDFDCTLTDRSNEYSLLALQGPESETILKELNLFPESDFPYYSVSEGILNDDKFIISRTGYTGEDGVELFCSHSFAKRIWGKLMAKGVTPCGLVARDILRLEVCFPLYGNELTDELTPLDCALKWTVKFKKETFMGKESLHNHDSKFRLIKLSLDKGIPRTGYPITCGTSHQVIGKVTSGTMSPILGKGIAIALVKKELFPKNRELCIKIRDKYILANYHTKPFVIGGHK